MAEHTYALQALTNIKATLIAENNIGARSAIVDTIWHSPAETLIDYIDNCIAALSSEQGEAEPLWYAVTSVSAPVIDKVIRRLDVAQEYADKLSQTWPDVTVTPLVAATAQAALQAQDVGALEYRGSYVADIHRRMSDYHDELMACWQVLALKGGQPLHRALEAAFANGHAVKPETAQAAPRGEVVVTKNEVGQIVAVTRQDADGRVLEVIAEAASGVDADAQKNGAAIHMAIYHLKQGRPAQALILLEEIKRRAKEQS